MKEYNILIVILGLFAAGQGVLLTFLLLTKRKNHDANVILAGLMSVFTITIVYSLYIVSGMYRTYPLFIGAIHPFPLLYGPGWYLYSRTLTTRRPLTIQKDLLHFLPFAAGYVFVTPYLLMSAEWKIWLMENVAERLPEAFLIVNLLMVIHGIIYLSVTVIHLKKYLNRILNFFSSIENISLRWLRSFTIAIAGVWMIVAFFTMVRIAGIRILNSLDPVVAVIISILVFISGYLGLRQQEIFEPARAVQSPDDTGGSPANPPGTGSAPVYKKSGLSDDRKTEINRRLRQLLESEKLYLNSTLTLHDLAGRLSVSEHNLSETINTGLNKTFYDLINTYRIEEFQRRLQDPQNKHFTITAIAYDSGFNSKSTFNAIFKKHTGLTPSEYKIRSAKK